MKDYNEIAQNALRRGNEIRKHNIEVRNRILKAGGALAACAVIGIFAYSYWPARSHSSEMVSPQKAAADTESSYLRANEVEQPEASADSDDQYALAVPEEQSYHDELRAAESAGAYDPNEAAELEDKQSTVQDSDVNESVTDKNKSDEVFNNNISVNDEETSTTNFSSHETETSEEAVTNPAVILCGDPDYEGAQESRIKPSAGQVYMSKQLTDLLADHFGAEYDVKIYIFDDESSGSLSYEYCVNELNRIDNGNFRVFIDSDGETSYLHAYMRKEHIDSYPFDPDLGYWIILANEYM